MRDEIKKIIYIYIELKEWELNKDSIKIEKQINKKKDSKQIKSNQNNG